MWEGKWLRTSSISTIFSFHWGKVLFHSCHFRSFISWGQPRLTVPSPYQHSYQWKWRQHCLQLGGGGCGVSRGSVRVYTIKLRWPWGWKHSLNCTLAPELLPFKHTTQLNKEAPVCLFSLMLVTGWRERGEHRNSLRWSSIYEIILALPALWVSPLPHPPVGPQVSGTKSHSQAILIRWLFSNCY